MTQLISNIAGGTFRAEALLVGDRIDVHNVPEAKPVSALPLVTPVGDQGAAVLFRYGVVVLFNVVKDERSRFLTRVRRAVIKALEAPECEHANVRLDPDAREEIQGDVITLHDASVERLQVVAYVLSKSVVLADCEAKVAESFDGVETLASQLTQEGRSSRSDRELLAHIGDALQSGLKMVGRAEVVESPELVWERPELEQLYLRLEREFEIRERHRVLEHKLALISRTAQTSLELLQNRRSLRVEWYIVILIVVEIALTLYEMFLRPHSP